jgi:hypothetical protein
MSPLDDSLYSAADDESFFEGSGGLRTSFETRDRTRMVGGWRSRSKSWVHPGSSVNPNSREAGGVRAALVNQSRPECIRTLPGRSLIRFFQQLDVSDRIPRHSTVDGGAVLDSRRR